jgi:Fe-S oxidoreductase
MLNVLKLARFKSMPIDTNVVKSLQAIVGLDNVLTDVEDLYVYSFEHIFRKQQYPTVKAIAKTQSQNQIKQIQNLAKKQNFTAILRSKGITQRQDGSDIVLIDDTKPVELKPSTDKTLSKQIQENIKEIHRTGHGTPRNIALALDTIFRSKPFSRLQENPLSSSYCTVAPSFNHIETWSSKGRALLMKGLADGHLQSSKKLADILYTCSTCGHCFAESLQGLEIDKAIKATRHTLAEKGYAPDVFVQTAKNIAEVGDPSSMPLTRRLQWAKTLPQQNFPQKAEVLYWVGCMVAARTPNTAKATANILTKANINYTMLAEKEGCCNYVLLASGLWNEAKKETNKLLKRIKETKASLLVTPCAGCYYTFTRLYPEILDIEMPLEVLHASQFIDKLLHNHALELKEVEEKTRITYHDPCSLGRHSNVYDAPRNVVKAIKNIELVEMPLNKSRARCCGGGGGLWTFNNQVSLDCASVRLKNDVEPLGVDSLVTACPTCQLNFRFSSVKNSMPIKIYDVAEIVESALN